MTETDILCSEYKLINFTDTIYAIFLKTGTGIVIFFWKFEKVESEDIRREA